MSSDEVEEKEIPEGFSEVTEIIVDLPEEEVLAVDEVIVPELGEETPEDGEPDDFTEISNYINEVLYEE